MGFLSLFKNIFMDDHHDSDKMIDTSITNKQILENIKKIHYSEYESALKKNEKTQCNKAKKIDYKLNIKKGKVYEKFVGEYIEKFGYSVDYRGLRKGKKDGGIDLVANNNNTYVLIQCKNWTKRKVTQKDIRVFVGDYYNYLENHPELKYKNTKAYFYVSNDLYHNGAKKYAEDKDFLELRVLEMKELDVV